MVTCILTFSVHLPQGFPDFDFWGFSDVVVFTEICRCVHWKEMEVQCRKDNDILKIFNSFCRIYENI